MRSGRNRITQERREIKLPSMSLRRSRILVMRIMLLYTSSRSFSKCSDDEEKDLSGTNGMEEIDSESFFNAFLMRKMILLRSGNPLRNCFSSRSFWRKGMWRRKDSMVFCLFMISGADRSGCSSHCRNRRDPIEVVVWFKKWNKELDRSDCCCCLVSSVPSTEEEEGIVSRPIFDFSRESSGNNCNA